MNMLTLVKGATSAMFGAEEEHLTSDGYFLLGSCDIEYRVTRTTSPS